MDFNKAKAIGKDIDAVTGGFDHNWVLNRNADGLQNAATLYDPGSGRLMEVWTTQPAIQFYTGNFLDGSITGKDGKVYGHRFGLCLETQHFPDSPNQPKFSSTELKAGHRYHTVTVFKFSAR